MNLITEINLDNLEEISLGASLLGTGGGGDPKTGLLMAKAAINKFGPIKVVQVKDLADEAVVGAISMMGAPTVSLEKIPNGVEFEFLLDELEKLFNKKIEYLYPVEAGGINSLVPLLVAAKKNIPILDGDTMGRAFPELQMVTFNIYNIKPFPIILSNTKKEKVIIDGKDFYEVEQKARQWTVKMGGSVAVGDGVVEGKIFKKIAIREIISLSKALGTIIKTSKQPFDDLYDVGGYKLFSGKIVDIVRKTEGGFNKGYVQIEGINESHGRSFTVHIQNENLVVFEGEKKLCMVPDLITLLDSQTAIPITTDSLKYGQRIVGIAFKCNEQWRSIAGLEIVGPKAFGYDFEYEAVEKLLGGKNV
ncbi:MAG: DUF917 domain-containing protein [Mycoplasmatales bacterium]